MVVYSSNLKFDTGDFAMIGTQSLAARLSCGVLVLLTAATARGGEFRRERIGVDLPLNTIEVSITVGTAGEELNEPVDLHLGLGFPLRLHPLGGAEREPGFAAYAQKSSLPAGVHSLQPGESATFEFHLEAPPTDDADELKTTPELLRDLRVRDAQTLGFASPGRSAWVLADYTVKIDGEVFASHQGVNADAATLRRELIAKLQQLAADYEFDAREAAELSETVSSGLATETEAARLRELTAKLDEASQALTDAALRANGVLPWFVESHEDFQLPGIRGGTIRTLEIGLTTQEGPQTGSTNPLYFWADGRKYLLTSEADPLADGRQLQTFQISAAELAANPLTRRRFTEIGIGMVGDDREQGRVADKAKLRRVTVLADGVPIYDSGKTPDDREKLLSLAFIPPAHHDNVGDVVQNAVTDQEVTLWKSSALLPKGSGPLEEFPEDVPPEPAVLNDVPVTDDPPLIIFWDGDDDPSTPRRRKRKRPAAAPTTIFIPTAAPAATPRPRPIAPQPGPNAPVLSNIRVNPAVSILRDGDQATVTWQVSGNISQVSSYRVDLFGVLPHKAVPLINTPLATQRGIQPLQAPAPGGNRTLQARPPAINVAAIRAQLVGAEESYLYVQPKVTALTANGTVLVSGFGSLLPLFPAGYTSPPAAIVLPGAVFLPGGIPSRTRPPSFQVLPAAGAPGAWQASTTVDPGTNAAGWILPGEQDTIPALTFASYVPTPPGIALPAYGAAVRPAAGGQRIAVQYEGLLPLPTNLPTPTRGWRVVAHVCFLGGTAPATAQVQSRVTLSTRPAAPAPFYTLQTPAPLPYTKFSSGTTPSPALLIDMPLRFDLMAANNLAASNHDATKYVLAPPFVAAGPTGFQSVAGGRTYVSVTFMVALQSSSPNDAVGIFGVRLVPDNN